MDVRRGLCVGVDVLVEVADEVLFDQVDEAAPQDEVVGPVERDDPGVTHRLEGRLVKRVENGARVEGCTTVSSSHALPCPADVAYHVLREGSCPGRGRTPPWGLRSGSAGQAKLSA